jgi:hypothetical protein
MCYNFDKNTCDRCRITKEACLKKHNYDRHAASFSLGHNGEVTCPECHKELELENLFALMDKREKEGKDLKKLMRLKHENQSKLRNQQ